MGMYGEIASSIVRLVCAVIGVVFSAIVIPWVKNSVIPWLMEKRVYNLVAKYVSAAEKLGESGAIDKSEKKNYVIELLKSKGVEITPEIEAFIESAVEALDIAIKNGISDIADEFKTADPEVAEG